MNTDMEKVKEIVEFHSCGASGNIFHLLATCRAILRRQHRIIDFNTMRDRVFDGESYEESLKVIGEYVELIDLDGRI